MANIFSNSLGKLTEFVNGWIPWYKLPVLLAPEPLADHAPVNHVAHLERQV